MVGFKRLNEFEEETSKLLTIRATEAYLRREKTKEGEKKTLDVKLEENPEIMTNKEERKKHHVCVDQKWFEERLKNFKNPETTKVRIADNEHPLEIVTGDVSLLLKTEGKEYYLLFCRDIFPQGWLMPGGCPGNREEVFDPLIVAQRECSEEVCILDKKGEIAYSLCSSEEEWKAKHQKWLKKSKKIVPKKIIQLSSKRLSSKKGIARDLVIMMGSEGRKKKNVNIFIDTQTASVSIILYRDVSLPVKISELMFYDGEEEGGINRPIGLFTKEEIINDEPPKVIFVSGQDILSVGFSNPKIKERITAS